MVAVEPPTSVKPIDTMKYVRESTWKRIHQQFIGIFIAMLPVYITLILNCFSILDRADSDYAIMLKEGMHIMWEKPTLNVQVKCEKIELPL